MTTLSYNELRELMEQGVIENSHPERIQGASIDLTLGDIIKVESAMRCDEPIDLSERPRRYPHFNSVNLIAYDGYLLEPGAFILGVTREVINMPNDMKGSYCLNSSLGRAGLDNAFAGFIDPGYQGTITVELKNVLQYHTLVIRPGMRVGQISFERLSSPVPEFASYRNRGSYNGTQGEPTCR